MAQRSTTPDNAVAPPIVSLSTPERASHLHKLLIKHLSGNKRHFHWMGLFNDSLDVDNEDRIEDLQAFLQSSFFEKLVDVLAASIDQLPRSLVSAMFEPHLAHRPVRRKPRRSASSLIPLLDAANLDPDDQVACLDCLLRLAFHTQRSQRTALPVATTSPVAYFSHVFHGPSLQLITDHVIVHNGLFPSLPPVTDRPLIHPPPESEADVIQDDNHNDQQHATPLSRTYYSKVLPIIQSSGFGKTRTCVQLSTISPGLLVCLRIDSLPSSHHLVSFPPQDALVYQYFDNAKLDLADVIIPTTPQEHVGFNKAHLRVLAWLSIYCKTLAHYLEYLVQQSHCWPPSAAATNQPPPTQAPTRDPCQPHEHKRCWRSVVYHLAAALHSPLSGFVPNELFRPPAQDTVCPHTALNRLAATRQAAQGKSLEPPALFGTHNLRKLMLDHICDAADELYEHMRALYAARLAEHDVLADAILDHMRPALRQLEQLPQAVDHQPFFFLALDECGSMASLLPAIRRVWHHASPRCTWILLIDTNSDLAPLAGATARQGSRRMNVGNTHQLTQAFSAMPLDVNFTRQDRESLFSDLPIFTLKQLNLMLPRLGRPLWSDKVYCSSQGAILPKPIIGKLVFPGEWEWPIQERVSSDKLDDLNQNLLALASRRLHLELSSRSGPEWWYKFVSHQVAQHLRFVGRIFNSTDSIISNTPSEPPLSAAAAWLFRCAPKSTLNKWDMVIQALTLAQDVVGFHTGAQGEFGVALLCTMALDLAVSASYSNALTVSHTSTIDPHINYMAVFGLVTVRQWLRNLIGQVNTNAAFAESCHDVDRMDEDLANDETPSALAAWADRAWLNFKHVVRLEEQVDHKHQVDVDTAQLTSLWFRHAAAQGISNQPGWDLLIPVYETQDDQPPLGEQPFDKSRLSYVAIQVKNCIKRPSAEVLQAAVGPHLACNAPKQCLELFLDLKSPPQGMQYSLRCHRNKDKQEAWLLSRHHLLIQGLNRHNLPILDRLKSPAKEQVRLLFGQIDSIDSFNFDSALAQHVRNQAPEDQDAWDQAQVRIHGALVDDRPTTQSVRQRRKQRDASTHLA